MNTPLPVGGRSHLGVVLAITATKASAHLSPFPILIQLLGAFQGIGKSEVLGALFVCAGTAVPLPALYR